jgi:thioredoxin-related protein
MKKSLCLLFILFIILSCEKKEFTSFKSYYQGLEKAKKENKPIFIHFTGFGCVGYNEFENDLIKNREILKNLCNNYISIELYVDDMRWVSLAGHF